MAIELRTVHPVLITRDIEAGLAFLTEKLGFIRDFSYGEPTEYGAASRGPIQIHVSKDYSGTGREGKGASYVMLTGVDEFYEEVKAKGVTFAVDIDTRPYGMRDFYVVDQDGNTIGFGEPQGE